MEKLLFCTANFKTGRGGISSYAFDFIEAFHDKYEIVVVASGTTEESAVKVHKCNYLDLSIKNAKYLLSIILEEKPDIIVNSAFALLALVTPYIDNKVRIVTVSHFVNGRYAWYAGLNGKYIDTIISLSSFGKKYIDKKFKIHDTAKTQVVFNFMPESSACFQNKKENSILKIVYPGGCSFAKSAEVVCKALKKLLKTDLQFEFYWLGSTKIAGGGKKYIHTNNIEDCLPKDKRIKHIGPVDRDISKQLLADANIFLLPSRGEGFPITLIEAMRCGCIPIVSDAKHGSLDAISNGKNGFVVKQGDAQAIIDLLSDIIQHHQNYLFVYNNSYNYYKQYLTDSVWKAQLSKIIENKAAHFQRAGEFCKIQYLKDRAYLTLLANEYGLYDRITQFYHFVYFRYIRYLL